MLLTDSIFLDSMGRGLTCASFFVVEIIPGLYYSICIAPIALSTLWIISMNVYNYFKHKQSNIYSRIFTVILRLFFTLQICNLFLKMDSYLSVVWTDLFWPFWIIFSIFIAISFSIVLILMTKLCTLLCMKVECSESN